MLRRLFHTKITIVFTGLIFGPAIAFAGAAVTYHGRLLDSLDQPVERASVVFKIQVRSPGTQDCLLFEETRTLDMRNSGGVFVIPIGDGQGHRTAGDPGITIEEIFSNNPGATRTGLTCNSGHDYQATALDSRKLIVSFDDGSGSGEQVLPPMDVNFVPFAIHASEATSALKVGATPASQIMSVASGTVTPLTAANFAELLLLVNGNSTAYVKPSSVPTCASGEVLKGTGGAFVCVTDSSGTDTLAGISCADGKILKRSAGAWACADESGVGTESDPTVQAYAKVAPGTGLTVSAGAIVPDFGTGAGKVAQGNDSRFTDARAPNGSATGDLAGSYPNPTVKGLRGNAIANTTPLNGQVYQWVLGSTEWQPKFLSFADLKKSDGTAQMPASCAANQTLAWSAITDVFTCADIGSLDASKITAGTLNALRLPADTMILTCADGKIAKRVAGAWACADDVGVGSEVDPSVAAYAKNPPATGLIVDGSNKIAPDFGTGAGKIVQGNDSRLSDTRVASDINGVVSTGILQRTGAGTFSTLGVAAPVTNSAGNIGLAVGAGLTLSSGSLVPDFGTASGKVAQGDDSRFPSSTCASGSYSRWTGSAWACDAGSASSMTLTKNSSEPYACDAGHDMVMVGTAMYTTCLCRNGVGWVSTSDGSTACNWNGIAIVTNGSSRNWSDGSFAASCNAYRNPSGGKLYQGATGDGVYTINPGTGQMQVYCDMTNNGGGWTLVMRGKAGEYGASCAGWGDAAAYYYTGSSNDALDGTASGHTFKMSDTVINAVGGIYRVSTTGTYVATRFHKASCTYVHTALSTGDCLNSCSDAAATTCDTGQTNSGYSHGLSGGTGAAANGYGENYYTTMRDSIYWGSNYCWGTNISSGGSNGTGVHSTSGANFMVWRR